MKYLLFILFIWAGIKSCMAQNQSSRILWSTKESTDLTQFVDRVLKAAPQAPGLSLVVVKGDCVVYVSGFGLADVENQVKATQETGYYIASSTKSFTALIAKILASTGKLDLSAPITKYAPFKNFKNQSLFSNISVSDLLTHQSGLDNPLLSISLAYSGEYTRESILRLTEGQTSVRKEGKVFRYSNDGYYFFSFILQEEFEISWKALVKQYIFSPLGMSNSHTDYAEGSLSNLAMPYYGILHSVPERAYLLKSNETMHAAGGIVSSATDLGKWLKLQLGHGTNASKIHSPNELISSTHKEMAKSVHGFSKVFEGTGYGLGWRTGFFKSTPLVYHFGGFPGYFCHISFLPDKDIGVAVLVNHSDGAVIGNLIAEYAYDLSLGNKTAAQHNRYVEKELPKLIQARQDEILKDQEGRAKRKWTLTLPMESYCGIYSHPDLGLVKIEPEGASIKVSHGILVATATPFTSPESARLEFLPGSGSVITFDVSGGIVKSLRYLGLEFMKEN